MIDELNRSHAHVVDQLTIQEPTLEKQLRTANGYMIASAFGIKAPIYGYTAGVGAIYDNQDTSVTYVNIERDELGFGLGYSEDFIISVFNDEESMEVAKQGVNTSSMVSSFKQANDQLYYDQSKIKDRTISTYTLHSSGVQASLSLSAIEISKNELMDDVDIDVEESNASIPLKRRSRDQVSLPKHWDRALPFYGQRVIDLGHDLPLPIGVSLIYASTYQPMKLYDLSVRNKDGVNTPIDFVSFEDSTNESEVPQIKIDAWIFPFLNVFATVGKVTGEADVNFRLEGDPLLNQLGIDCRSARGAERILCERWEGNNSQLYSPTPSIEGMSYTLGTLLAVGWDNYFISAPVSFTKMTMDKRTIDGTVITVSPRLGAVIPFQNGQSLALYVGASYIHNDVRITGYQSIPNTSKGIDYQISQQTGEPWEPIIGGNYSFNGKWSVFFEWTGSEDGRQQMFGGINRRF
ncbi:hypothetical protein BSZ04_16680 [Vibrio rotiferianus]|nr:hypothetical protein BSZ04_16680 [Vibrio rotiferianus]